MKIIVDVSPDTVEDIITGELSDILVYVKEQKGFWSEDWKKDAKALKRVIGLYTTRKTDG